MVEIAKKKVILVGYHNSQKLSYELYHISLF